jgi:hypothetical protein
MTKDELLQDMTSSCCAGESVVFDLELLEGFSAEERKEFVSQLLKTTLLPMLKISLLPSELDLLDIDDLASEFLTMIENERGVGYSNHERDPEKLSQCSAVTKTESD